MRKIKNAMHPCYVRGCKNTVFGPPHARKLRCKWHSVKKSRQTS